MAVIDSTSRRAGVLNAQAHPRHSPSPAPSRSKPVNFADTTLLIDCTGTVWPQRQHTPAVETAAGSVGAWWR